MAKHIKQEPKLYINQLVAFVKWNDEAVHKDGPSPGDTGLITDIVEGTISHKVTFYVVTYKPFTPFARAIQHYASEITPLVPMEETQNESRFKTLNVPAS